MNESPFGYQSQGSSDLLNWGIDVGVSSFRGGTGDLDWVGRRRWMTYSPASLVSGKDCSHPLVPTEIISLDLWQQLL